MVKYKLHAYGSAICRTGLLLLLLVAACSKKSSITSSENTETAKTYYVSPDGSDANTGNINNPLRSINSALSKVIPGDTVLVRQGIYAEKVLFLKSGRLNKLI